MSVREFKSWSGRFGKLADATIAGLKRAGVGEDLVPEVTKYLLGSTKVRESIEEIAYQHGLTLVVKVVAIFRLKKIFTTPAEAIAAGDYIAGAPDCGSVSDYPFLMRPTEQDEHDVMVVSFEYLDHDPTDSEMLALVSRLGLVRPTYEDVLRLGAEHQPAAKYCRSFVGLFTPEGEGLTIYYDCWGGNQLLLRQPSIKSGHDRNQYFIFRE